MEVGAPRRKVVHMESLTGSDYLPRPNHVRIYDLVFGRLQADALNREDSLDLLNRCIHELEE